MAIQRRPNPSVSAATVRSERPSPPAVNDPATAVSAITSLQLNAAAIAPEGAVLLAMLACLLVDLAGEKAASRWVPLFSYLGLGGALVLLALQWNAAPLMPSFLGAFLADNLAIAFRSVVASRIAAYSPTGVPARST